MPSAGVARPGIIPTNKPPAISPTQSAYDAYGTAAKQQGQDYTGIMNKYRDLYDSIPSGGAGNANNTINYDVTVPTYQTTQDYTASTKNLADRSRNGGYSPEDIANIRERGISPIRSVYSNAQQGLSRQRALQGGYSPNFAAVSAKMAREMSSQLSDATTNVNAQIAQDVASQKATASSQYATQAANEQSNRNNFELDRSRQLNEFGLSKMGQQERDFEFPIQSRLSALNGMTGLYGTTPGNTALMQHGAQNQAVIQNDINQQNKNYGLNLVSRYMGAS